MKWVSFSAIRREVIRFVELEKPNLHDFGNVGRVHKSDENGCGLSDHPSICDLEQTNPESDLFILNSRNRM